MRKLLGLLPLVCSLLCVGNPSTVFGTVIPVDVNAVNLGSGEIARSHVRHVVVNVVPALADRNASRTIAIETVGVRVVTPLMHVSPLVKKRGAGKPMPSDGIAVKASTAANAPVFQPVQPSDMRALSASTFTDGYVSVSAFSFRDLKYGQSGEHLADCYSGSLERLKAEIINIHILTRNEWLVNCITG